LENEVKPLIEFLKRMNKDIIEPQDNLPLDRLPFFISQSDWTANRVKEYLNPEEYYADTSHQKIIQEMEDLEESFRE
jgi:hypothetical protein